MASVTKLTEDYLREHASIRDCLKKGVVNFSRLARSIIKDRGLKRVRMEAVLIACRRAAEKIRKEKSAEEAIKTLLKHSQLEIKNKIVVVIVDKQIYVENLIDIEKKIRKKADTFYALEATSSFTIITTEKYLDELKKLFEHDLIRVSKDLAMIVLKSSERMESTPGVMAHLYALFSDHGVNICETMSCWTDTIFVVAEADVGKCMEFLQF
ncbi:MAG: hypothetical protein Q7R76_03690 [Candidatus Woesearchaeota archaeon]|nr:hypothetical protein [Candidatus Woesearchaeota archaeon]